MISRQCRPFLGNEKCYRQTPVRFTDILFEEFFFFPEISIIERFVDKHQNYPLNGFLKYGIKTLRVK